MFIVISIVNLCFSNSTHGYLQADVSIEYVTAPVLLTESVFM